MESTKTADEMIASVDATLASWRSAFESSPTKRRTKNADDDRPSTINEAKSPPPWEDSDEYHRRLSTFKPTTYFAKPLALSPLVCAAFGWENTGRDIIKCRHPKCGATICVAFHPSLNEESDNRLCQKYLDMLVSSHTSRCPFRSFASRWSKVMHQRGSRGKDCIKSKLADNIITKENNPEQLMNKVSEVLSDSKTNFYVPPYFLSLSDEFLRFEDCTIDGSITRERAKEGALQIRDKLQARNSGESEVEVVVPDAVTNFFREMHPDADLEDVIYQKESTLKAPYLLSTFGWSICDESAGENTMTVKCNMCQARTWLASSPSTDEEPSSRKRRRINTRDDANLKLIDSHRVYCPYVSGFSFGPGQQSELPGWKLVVSNLLKPATQIHVE
mmetsp:Transcript_24935/g.53777  ORF Transcript_24935/g.53777 Transcript_24935/m.53777 type:complete len:389 (+) Transcript_24935:59-1225(+)